jgi:transposase
MCTRSAPNIVWWSMVARSLLRATSPPKRLRPWSPMSIPLSCWATGSWHATYDALVATDAAVKLAHPARIKAIASAKVKTDKIDARILAHLLRADLIPEAWAPPAYVRELRDLVRLRWRFVSQRTTAKNRITNLLARQNLRFSGTDLFGRGGREWLEELELPVHTRSLITLLLASIQEADAHVAVLTSRLHELLDGDRDMGLLMSIPGVGFITAATLTAEVGDWSRFSSARQLSAYFGLVPSVRASGGVAHYGHITRAGSPHARRALVEAAHTARKLPGPVRHHYLSLVKRRGKKVALVAAARVLLELSWTLLHKKEVFLAA